MGIVIPPGSYFFYRVKERIALVAANVRLDVNASKQSYHKLSRPDPDALAAAMLSRLSGVR
jgi:hypothetical protein